MQNTITLNQNKDFQKLYQHGVSFVTPYTVIYMMPNRRNGNQNRLGITAGKKVGNAVQRNRAKRLLRQAYRELEAELPTGVDYVMVARARLCADTTTSAKVVRFLRRETVQLLWQHYERPRITVSKGGKHPSPTGEEPS